MTVDYVAFVRNQAQIFIKSSAFHKPPGSSRVTKTSAYLGQSDHHDIVNSLMQGTGIPVMLKILVPKIGLPTNHPF